MDDNRNTAAILKKVDDLHTALIGSELVPGAIPRLNTELLALERRMQRNEQRLTRLETWRTFSLGAAFIIGVLLKIVVPALAGGHNALLGR